MLYIIENNLREYLGHFFNCTIGLKQAADEAGKKAEICANVNASKKVLMATEAQPLFTHLSWKSEKASDPIASMRKNGDDFNHQCCKLHNVSTQDSILVCTALQDQVYGIAKYLLSLPSEKRPWLALNFHWENFRDNPKRKAAYVEAFNLLRQATDSRKTIITAPTLEAAEALKSVSHGLNVEVFPIPMNYGSSINAPKQITSHPVVAYLGRSLRRKGSQYIPVMIQKLNKKLPQLRYHIQATLKAPEMLFLLLNPNVRLHWGGISPEVYFKLLHTAHIFLFPYSVSDYSDRTSGIFAECAAHRSIAIVPENTWLSKQIRQKHASGVIYDPRQEYSIESAVVKAVSNSKPLLQSAYERSKYWWEQQSAKAYLDKLYLFWKSTCA